MSINLIVYPVQDLEKAKTFYNQFLGVTPYTDSPYYVGYKVGDVEIGLDPNATIGPIVYTDVTDIEAALGELVAVGAEVVQEATNVGGGLMVAKAKDATGNVVGLRQVA